MSLALSSCLQSLQEDDRQFQAAVKAQGKKSFKFFFNNIFAESLRIIDGDFLGGYWLDTFCDRLQVKKKTCTLAARKHGKTTIMAGFVAWLIFKCDEEKRMLSEYLYIMYSDDLACEKIKKIKQYINCNVYFAGIRDAKPTAESVIEYYNNGHIVSVKPSGVGSFKRGKHPDGVICDDILKDPQSALDLTQIEKITQIFEAEITSLPKEDGFLHVVGTSQDETDIMHVLKMRSGWDWSFNPAILDYKTKKVLWVERFSYDRLKDIEKNETGAKNFQKEYQLIPTRTAEGFFDRSEIEALIDKELINHSVYKRPIETLGACYAGADLGKKRHPSHLAVYQAIYLDDITILAQVCSMWFDGIDYQDQLKAFDCAIHNFGINKLYWDNTRAEFEGFMERGELPSEMMPFVFSRGGKEQLAAEFDKKAGAKEIILLNDERQSRSILSVDGSLQSPETPEGHGDGFWSNALAIKAFIDDNAGSGFV